MEPAHWQVDGVAGDPKRRSKGLLPSHQMSCLYRLHAVYCTGGADAARRAGGDEHAMEPRATSKDCTTRNLATTG